MYFPIHSLGRVFFCKKECQYTASSWDELENTPSSDLEICLSRDFAPLGPRDCPRAISWASGCKIPASANLSILGGRIFQYIPPLGSVLLQSFPSEWISKSFPVGFLFINLSNFVLENKMYGCGAGDKYEIWASSSFCFKTNVNFYIVSFAFNFI